MTKDMTTGAITPLLVKFTIPLVLGNLFPAKTPLPPSAPPTR